MMIYLNMKTNCGVETVDEFDPGEFDNQKEFNRYVDRIVYEYSLAGMAVYKSKRATKE